MGYCILTYEDGSREVLGDINQARKAEGLPHYREGQEGEVFIDTAKIDEMDSFYNGEKK